jgi:hypothetical protein
MRRESLPRSEPVDPHVEPVLVVVSQKVRRPPASKRRTIRSRPRGVSRANLCMFAEPSSEWVGGFATPSFTRYGSVNNLLIMNVSSDG